MQVLEDIILHLQSNENVVRRAAEDSFTEARQRRPQQMLSGLVEILGKSKEESTRAFSAVLLRKCLEDAKAWSALGCEEQLNVRTALLSAIGSESKPHVRRRIAHATCQLALLDLQNEETWPDLLRAVISLWHQNEQSKKEASVELLGILVSYTPEILIAYDTEILQLLATALETASVELRVSALQATIAYLLHVNTDTSANKAHDILTSMLQTIESALVSGDELLAREGLSGLLDLIGSRPQFCKSSVPELGRAMLAIGGASNLEAATRQLSIEVLVCFAERAPAMFRKESWLIEAVVPLCLDILCGAEVEDVLWTKREEDTKSYGDLCEDDTDGLCEFAAEALERIFASSKASSVLPVAHPLVKQLLVSSDPRGRRAGLYTLALLLEPCKQLLGPSLDVIVGIVVASANDPALRVKYAAVIALSEIIQVFSDVEKGPNIQSQYGNHILPILTNLAQEHFWCPRVQCRAIMGLNYFCQVDYCKSSAFKPHAQNVLEVLFECLRHGQKQVQEQAIVSIAMAAQILRTRFTSYYEPFMATALQILKQHDELLNDGLLGKTLEAVAFVGEAVGKQVFFKDAKCVMDLLLQLQEKGSMAAELDFSQSLAYSCNRIGKIMGSDFAPYLSIVIPQLIKDASHAIECVVTDEDEDFEDDNMDVMLLQMRGMTKKRIGLNAIALQEKVVACNMLFQYAFDCGGMFLPYVEPAAQVLLPLISFPLMSQVRLAAILSQPRLLKCAIIGAAERQSLQALLVAQLDALIKGLDEEKELECLGAIGDAMSEIMELWRVLNNDPPGLPISRELAARLLVAIQNAFATSENKRREKKALYYQFTEDDEEEYAEIEEEEEWNRDLLDALADTIQSMIKTYKSDFMDLFDQVVFPFVGSYLNQREDWHLLGIALCIMDDLLENCGSRAIEYYPKVLPAIFDGLKCEEAAVQQAAAYGAGVCAQNIGHDLEPFVMDLVSSLIEIMTSSKDNQSSAVNRASDNAASALLKFLQTRQLPKARDLWNILLQYLPLTNDRLEAQVVHQAIIELVESGDSHILGEDCENIPRIVSILADILADSERTHGLSEEDIEEETPLIPEVGKTKIIKFLAKFEVTKDDDV